VRFPGGNARLVLGKYCLDKSSSTGSSYMLTKVIPAFQSQVRGYIMAESFYFVHYKHFAFEADGATIAVLHSGPQTDLLLRRELRPCRCLLLQFQSGTKQLEASLQDSERPEQEHLLINRTDHYTSSCLCFTPSYFSCSSFQTRASCHAPADVFSSSLSFCLRLRRPLEGKGWCLHCLE